jgi:uncharacterized protein YndB with AHSA1/START domain
MPDSLHEITIAASPKAVYDAWTTAKGLKSWWTQDSRVASKVGGVHVFAFNGGEVEFHFRIDAQEPGRRVRWTGLAAPKMPDEWVGTRIDVELDEPEPGQTRMRFGHLGWQSADGFYRLCNSTWGELVYRLRDFCEGKGRGPLFAG